MTTEPNGRASVLFATPHSSQGRLNAARALLEAGVLGGYYTTLAFAEDGAAFFAAERVDSMLGTRFAAQLGRRVVTGIPGHLVHGFPFVDAPRTLAARLRLPQGVQDRLTLAGLAAFDRHVARRVAKGCDAVYAFRGAAYHAFRTAGEAGAARIYGVAGFDRQWLKELYRSEAAKFPKQLGAYVDPHASNAQIGKAKVEWEMADLVVVISDACLASHRGRADLAKAKVVPLAFPEVGPERHRVSEGPLRVLWAGSFSVRKGAHYLLQAAQQLSPSAVDIRVFGAIDLPAAALAAWPPTFTIRPTIPHAQLMNEYRLADVLVMPTLSDGFAMVISEAMSQGCPVITTARAGAAEFIRPGENGIIVAPGDAQALADALTWCVSHRDGLQEMGEAARRTAAGWQWPDYRAALGRVLAEALG